MGASAFKVSGLVDNTHPVVATVPSGATYQLMAVSAHLNQEPFTRSNLNVKVTSKEGPEYALVLYATDLAGLTDLLWVPDASVLLVGGETLEVSYANPDGCTAGVQVTLKAV